MADQLLVTINGVTGCAYHGNVSACNYAIAVGVISFLICLTFLVKDVLYVIIDYSEAMVVSSAWYMYM